MTNDNDNNLMLDEHVKDAAECLKVMGHPARIRIAEVLCTGEFPVHEIAKHCNLPPNQTCEHLRLLKHHGLLESHRIGRSVFYKITSPYLIKLINCIKVRT